MSSKPRYRTEDGRSCIDIRIRNSRQLFDVRDPAPFRERDLDDDAVEYIVGALEELPRKAEVKIVFWISEEESPHLSMETIVAAVRGHFAYECERLDRHIRQHIRRGQLFLLLGLVALVAFLSTAELVTMIRDPHVRQILREGLVITGWVAMWRPLETLLYDWWPLAERRRFVRRILGASMEVNYRPASNASW